jgi:N-acylneuraminate cytidylyltransferase
MMGRVSSVALIPARSGSKRLPGKNVRRLAGHPLLAYTVSAAVESGLFAAVIVSTESREYAAVAEHYGAEVPFLRPEAMAGDTSPDFEWVEYTLAKLADGGRRCDCFSILRPTSPFRVAATIRRAWEEFAAEEGIDSLRAVEKCAQHPAKMWVVEGKRMTPLLPGTDEGQPLHSRQYQSLPEVYVQNASLEIAWSRVVFEKKTIAGDVILPFFTEGHEGFDLNRPLDWEMAERLVASGQAVLPGVSRPPWRSGGKAT